MNIPLEALNLIMLNVGIANHDGDWNWERVLSPFIRIYYVIEGHAILHLPDRTISLKSNHMYIIPAHTMHSYECHGTFRHFYLHLYEGFKKEMDLFSLYEFPYEIEAGDDDYILFRNLCNDFPDAKLPSSNPNAYDNKNKFNDYVCRYNSMQLYQKMRIRGSVLILVSRFMRYASPRLWTSNEKLTKVLTYIHDKICEDIDIETLSDIACISIPYFVRLFKHEFGIAPLQYINQKKMERAQLLLISEKIGRASCRE